MLKRLKHIITALIWLIVGGYLLIVALLHVPMVQTAIGAYVASALSHKLGTQVSVGKVNLGFFNRVIIDNVSILDKACKPMFSASRLSAKLDYIDLVKGKVVITSAQIFTPKFNFYKPDATSQTNFQFVLDSLASKDTTKSKPINLAVNSLVIRHGSFRYDELDKLRRKTFDINHLNVTDISTHIIAKAIGGDSLNVNVKRLSFKEVSGINVSSLSLEAVGNKNGYVADNFKLVLPESEILIPKITFTPLKDGFAYSAELAQSNVKLSELTAFIPDLKHINRQLVVKAKISGTDKSINLKAIEVSLPTRPDVKNLSVPSDIHLIARGKAYLKPSLSWNAYIYRLAVTSGGMRLLAGKVPEAVTRLNTLLFKGYMKGTNNNIALKGNISSGAGKLNIDASKHGDYLIASVNTPAFNLRQVLADNNFGIISANIKGNGSIKNNRYSLVGKVARFDYNNYSYRDISVDGKYNTGTANGKLSISDPNVDISINGSANLLAKNKSANLTARIMHIAPSKLNLFKGKLSNAEYSGNIDANIIGSNINNAVGKVAVTNFTMRSSETDYALDSLILRTGNAPRGHYVTMNSDFGWAVVYGKFSYATLPQSIENAIVRKLPGITALAPLKYRRINSGDIAFAASIHNSDWAKALFNVPVELHDTLKTSINLASNGSNINADINVPNIVYGNWHLKNIKATAKTIDDKLSVEASLRNMRSENIGTDIKLESSAANDRLVASLGFDNNAKTQRLHGKVYSDVLFTRNDKGQSQAILDIKKSKFNIGDTVFTISPATVTYSRRHVSVNNLFVGSDTQGVRIDGTASDSVNDPLTVELDMVNLEYIMDLINFHSVDFSGSTSGNVTISNAFAKPKARADLKVDGFRLQNGRLGTLYAHANWNNDKEQIDIDGEAQDTLKLSDGTIRPRLVDIDGFIAPVKGAIDLNMKLSETRGELLEKMCGSFLRDIDLTANGNLRLWGTFKSIYLTGEVEGNGYATVVPLNVRYRLPHLKARFTKNEIIFHKDSLYDRLGNLGMVEGRIKHHHLGSMTYNIDVDAHNLLAFNYGYSDDSNFYGTVYGTGNAKITGGPGRVDIDVNVTPEKGSEVVYDVSTDNTITSQDFIHWTDRDSTIQNSKFKIQSSKLNVQSSKLNAQHSTLNTQPSTSSDVHMNLLINANPSTTLRIIMDRATGDYITLNGNGTLRAAWFNKGELDIFGTYVIDHGIYSLTIQNIIQKKFEFTQGSTITFGGDPYSALLRLTAQYSLPSVSLSDLQLGRSFSSNNIRVNCLMDITGTPASPQVSFDLDFPTLSSDAKQMINSLINGEEEMNQQVVYLLAVGRFYARGSNNADIEQGPSQTSLAMQSLLSGQLSQQLNNLIGTVVNNSNWNFGANISTGTEGFNNAQYEGLLSGRMFNNRLIFNGQFGYRDNANATTSFIGDFDLRYLIFPNGNFSVHVYNQTNDRYFTRNSLTTQGIGFILKKDFSSLSDLFGIKKKKKNK